jgi:hypothetical protein
MLGFTSRGIEAERGHEFDKGRERGCGGHCQINKKVGIER